MVFDRDSTEGRESIAIEDVDVARGQEIDQVELGHSGAVGAEGHVGHTCVECAVVANQRAVLREGLHARGIDLPVEVFQPS